MGELIRREPALPRTWTRIAARSALTGTRVFDLLIIGRGVIGAEVVDRVCRHLGVGRRSRTADECLVEASIGPGFRDRVRTAVGQAGLPETTRINLVGRYGTEATSILGLLGDRPRLAALMDPAPVSVAEVMYGARHESVDSVGDFALRRTGLAWSSPDHGLRWARLVARELATELDWSPERTDRAVSRYRSELDSMGVTPDRDAAPLGSGSAYREP